MKEKLIIKNFGPIKSIELDLRKITVFIGEQATGKSTIAKVLSVCRYFSYIVDYKILKDYEGSFINGLRYWKIYDYLKNNTFISYENSDYKVEINSHKSKEEDNLGNIIDKYFYLPNIFPNSDRFKKLILELEDVKNIAINNNELDWIPSENFFRTSVKKVMNNSFYFPTERGLQSIFSLGQSSIHNLANSLFNQLAKLNNISDNFQSATEIEPLDIKYKNFNGKGFIKKKSDNSYYTLANGASGFQSSIPIVLAIKYYSFFKKRKKTFIIEEPEINLFPSAQKKLMAFFIKNVNENGHSFIIPTHSPYFLSAINDYLLAYKKGQINEKETNEIIKKEYWLNIDDISCYQLKNGKAYPIIDKKSGLISDNIIDDVSDDMNDEFENLLDIR